AQQVIAGESFSYTKGAAMDAAAIRTALAAGENLVAETKSSGVINKLVAQHDYAILGVSADGQTVTLYNPWGRDRDGAILDGANDGVVTVSWQQFKANFAGYYKS